MLTLTFVKLGCVRVGYFLSVIKTDRGGNASGLAAGGPLDEAP